MGFISSLLDLFFPPKCVFCRRVLDQRERESRVCRRCRDEISYNEELLQPRSSHNDSPSEHSSQNDLPSERSSLDTLCAPLVYRGNVRAAIRRFKFGDRSDYATPLGRFIADEVARRYRGEYDVITWAPISRRRKRRRGYDQSMLLAEAAALALDTVAVSTLEKIRDTKANSRLGAAKRAENVRGAYAVTDRALVEGKRVLIIDDVYTTGATLGECARTLREAGASSVIGAAVAVAGVDADD